MARKPDARWSRDAIAGAALELLSIHGTTGFTVDAVARQAGVAKGLVHYHFKTKRGLVQAVALELAAARRRRWAEAFRADDPQAAIDRTWQVLTDESSDGTARAWLSLFGPSGIMPEQMVKEATEGFRAGLAQAADELLQSLKLHPRIPAVEIGWLLAAVVQGMSMELLGGADPAELAGAYAAAWLGVLALTAPGG